MVIKTDNLILYTEIIAVCSQIHAKHINALWAEHRISEYRSRWYIKSVLGFERLMRVPERMISKASTFMVETAITKVQRNKSPNIYQIPVELINL